MRTKTIQSIFLAVFGVLSLACSRTERMAAIDGFAQGTTYHIVVEGCEDMQLLKTEMDSILDDISASMSLFDQGSLINAINSNKTDSLDKHIIECINAAHIISEQSEGNYDITIKPLVQVRGFLAGEASDSFNVDSLLEFVGYNKISIASGRLVKQSPSVEIDLSSIAQGYTADVLSEYLSSKGYLNYLVEIGGEIMCKGQREQGRNWRVGIDKPIDDNIVPGAELQVILSIPSGKGLATSGNYRKYTYDNQGNKVVHTISPITGQSVVSNLLSATVVVDNATDADAYGTLFMVIGLDASKEFLGAHPELDAYLVYGNQDGCTEVYATSGMQSYILE